MVAEDLADALRAELRARPDPVRAQGEKAYLKSDQEHIGVPVPEMRRIVRRFAREHHDLDRFDLARIARSLYREPVHEYRLTAALLLDAHVDELTAAETALVEDLVRESVTWAQVDVLAGVERALRDWCAQDTLWLRRSGILGFRTALRGDEEFERYFPVFTELVAPLLTDPRFFVRKAIGWTLREAGKHHPDEVFAWAHAHVGEFSGVTLRETVKYLREDQRERLRVSATRPASRATRTPSGTARRTG